MDVANTPVDLVVVLQKWRGTHPDSRRKHYCLSATGHVSQKTAFQSYKTWTYVSASYTIAFCYDPVVQNSHRFEHHTPLRFAMVQSYKMDVGLSIMCLLCILQQHCLKVKGSGVRFAARHQTTVVKSAVSLKGHLFGLFRCWTMLTGKYTCTGAWASPLYVCRHWYADLVQHRQTAVFSMMLQDEHIFMH